MSRCRVADPQLARLGLTLHHAETCISPAAAPFPAEKVPFAHPPQSDLLFIGACPAEIPPKELEKHLSFPLANGLLLAAMSVVTPALAVMQLGFNGSHLMPSLHVPTAPAGSAQPKSPAKLGEQT